MRVVRADFFALFRAIFAGVGAFLAVFHVVFATFLGATATRFGAMFGNRGCEIGIAREQFRCDDAQKGTIHVQLDATRHPLDVFFPQTRRSAIFAGGGASVTGFNAVFKILVHNEKSRATPRIRNSDETVFWRGEKPERSIAAQKGSAMVWRN
jgi:hypothetical protein